MMPFFLDAKLFYIACHFITREIQLNTVKSHWHEQIAKMAF